VVYAQCRVYPGEFFVKMRFEIGASHPIRVRRAGADGRDRRSLPGGGSTSRPSSPAPTTPRRH
jgi:hypothetical protein